MSLKKWVRSLAFSAAAVPLFVSPAAATITGGAVAVGALGAKFIKLSIPLPNPAGPPNSVGQDTFELPNLYAFDEDQNIKLKSSLRTDVGKNPIPAGTVVASHYVFFDPGPSEEILGTVDFDSRVVAILEVGMHLMDVDRKRTFRGREPLVQESTVPATSLAIRVSSN